MKKLLAVSLLATSTAVMAAGDIEAGKMLYSNACVACHGANGEGGIGPNLQGRSVEYIQDLLSKYKAGEQVGPLSSMMALATGLSESDIENLAVYISTLK